MSDFVFCNRIIPESLINDSFKQIYNSENCDLNYFVIQNKTFAISKNLYNGFQLYETDKHICAVVGGPVLNFTENSFISHKGSNEGTKAIYSKWVLDNNIIWHEDLDGPYVIILVNKISGNIDVVTDMMSFIPVYLEESGTISTHIIVIDNLIDCRPDQISIADYIINDVVTFPFTFFKDITQLFPASEHKFVFNDNKFKHSYNTSWMPHEKPFNDSNFKTVSERLRDGIQTYVNKLIQANPKVGVLLSGGEDSRAVLGMIPLDYPKDCFMFSEHENFEVEIAKKVAKKHNGEFYKGEIDKQYIIDTFFSKSDLVGIGNDCAHVHSFRFHKEFKFSSYDAIFGGFLADSFLKALYITRNPVGSKFKNSNCIRLFSSEVIEQVETRCKSHLKFIQKIRPYSYDEWIYLYPASMNKHLPNISGHRRLFRNFEPFTCNEVIKISALVPQKLKLNRFLFQSAMKTFYKNTKWVVHNRGHLPYFSYEFNKYWIHIYKFNYFFYKIILRLNGNRNLGSWLNWTLLLNSSAGDSLYDSYIPSLFSEYNYLFSSFTKDVFRYNLTDTQRRNLLQIAYHLNHKS